MAVLGLGIGLLYSSVTTSRESLVSGVRDAFLLDAALGCGGLFVAALFVGGDLRSAAHLRRHLHRAHP